MVAFRIPLASCDDPAREIERVFWRLEYLEEGRLGRPGRPPRSSIWSLNLSLRSLSLSVSVYVCVCVYLYIHQDRFHIINRSCECLESDSGGRTGAAFFFGRWNCFPRAVCPGWVVNFSARGPARNINSWKLFLLRLCRVRGRQGAFDAIWETFLGGSVEFWAVLTCLEGSGGTILNLWNYLKNIY